MTKREKIARAAAKQAALSTYKAVLNAPTKKVASTDKGIQTVIDIKAVAKSAAAGAYNAIVRLADGQNAPMEMEPNQPGQIERALEAVLPGSPVTTWFGNHYRGQKTQGIDPEKFKADFATLPKGAVTQADKDYLRGEVTKAFGGQITV